MSAAVTKVNGCARISDGLPNLDICFTLYKYYTINFFKNQTRAGGGHMEEWTGVNSGRFRGGVKISNIYEKIAYEGAGGRIRRVTIGDAPTIIPHY